MNTFTFFSTSSGNRKDNNDQKSKDGKCKKIKSQPLINLGLGIGGSTTNTRNFSDFSDNSEKDNSFVVTVEKEVNEGEVDDHDSDYDDHVVEKEGCRKNSVVRLTEEQVEELKRQLIIFKYIVWGLPIPIQLVLPIWRSFSSSCVLRRKGLSPISLTSFSESVDYLHKMDPELGRCRRTDGKKWRCHQSVIPNEKYCQKHMHRGSKRSRKLVESSLDSGEPKKLAISCEIPEKVDKVGRTSVVIGTLGSTETIAKYNVNGKLNDQVENEVAENEKIAVMKLASGLDFSPKSVLQNGMGMVYTTSEDQKSISESETRCNRTDGKKWRCKKKVIPNYKYCPQHLSRKMAQTGGPSLGLSAFKEAQTSFDSKLGVDTNLKISLPRNFNEDSVAHRGGGSTNSSEATESDEDSTGVFKVITLSP